MVHYSNIEKALTQRFLFTGAALGSPPRQDLAQSIVELLGEVPGEDAKVADPLHKDVANR